MDVEPAVDLNDPRGGYYFAVVGESFHQDALARLAGARLAQSETVVVPCRISPEPSNHDSNCMAVHIDGVGLVGHFSREDAEAWRNVRSQLALSGLDAWCWGHLRGGTTDKPNIGIWLNLMGARGALSRVKAAIDPKHGRRKRSTL